jgi:hypothetical protein
LNRLPDAVAAALEEGWNQALPVKRAIKALLGTSHFD